MGRKCSSMNSQIRHGFTTRVYVLSSPSIFLYRQMVDCGSQALQSQQQTGDLYERARPVTIIAAVPLQHRPKMKRCQKLGHPAMIERCQHAVRTGIVE